MSQGRKRGYAGIIATQRLSKLNKDAAAEANNVIIGRTWLDADQARAGDALGLSKSDRLKLRDLEQGEFYAFGPAFRRPGIAHFRSDRVRTTHPRPGEGHVLTAPAPSKAIRGVLEKFAGLPHEVEAEIRGLDEARRRIAELERQIRKARDSNSPPQLDQLAI
jgi:DNA helicase HerA-like ATPase